MMQPRAQRPNSPLPSCELSIRRSCSESSLTMGSWRRLIRLAPALQHRRFALRAGGHHVDGAEVLKMLHGA
eukprot:18329-Pleurochrysis_carterae.AAC.1